MSPTVRNPKESGACSLILLKEITAGDLLVIVFSLGLAGGLAEVLLITVRHSFVPILDVSRDYVWMTPTAVMLSTLLVSSPFLFLRCFANLPALVRLTLISSCTVVLFDLLLFFPGMHHAVLLLLAVSMSILLSALLIDRMESVITHARKSIPWLLLAVILPGVIIHGAGWLEENRSISNLPAPRENSPNIILVSLDTVRAANLSVYGYSRATTPRLESFARDGVVFEHALASSPWTLPAHATLFTGRWHHELSVGYDTPLDSTFPTLAEFLASRGYLTAGFVANMAYCSYETGLDRGFIQYEDYTVSLGQIFESTNLKAVLNNWRLRKFLKNDEHLNRKSAGVINSSIFKWLEETGDRPYFLFVNYYDAHGPYLPPPPYDQAFGPPRPKGKYSPVKRWLWIPTDKRTDLSSAELREEMDAYDGALKYLDDQLGALIDQVSRLGQLENTLIIITADHGEEFAEHGVYGHGNSLYRAGVEVPLIFRFPQGKVPSGIRIEAPVTLRNLAATVVDLLDLMEESPFPGRSLARYWQGEYHDREDQPNLQTVLYAKGNPDWFPVSKGDMHSVVSGGLRYILNGDGVEELYDFDHDPWEENDLAKIPAYQGNIAEFRRSLDQVLASPVGGERSNQ